jgi:DNA-binding transcriptional LysR family regulator
VQKIHQFAGMTSLKIMRTYVQVVQSGSFAAAAERLGVSPSIVSKQIGQLERHLGARLLQRTTRAMVVTEIGEAYCTACQAVIAQVDAMEEDVAAQQGKAIGHITIKVPHSIGILHLGRLITEFCAEYSGITVTIATEEFPIHGIDMFERRSDVVLHLGPVVAPAITARELTQVVWLPYASRKYLKQHGTPQVPADLRRHNCLIHQAVFPDGRWRFISTKGETMVTVSGTVSANSVMILTQAVQDGVGIALLPSFCTDKAVADGSLVRVLHGYEGPHRHLYIAYEANRMLPRRVRLFIDFMTRRLKKPPWDLPTARTA